jgi:hypothetical protein
MQTLSDGGGIYTLGRQTGTTLSNNLIHSIPPNVGVSSSVGVYCDQGSTSIDMVANAFHSIAKSPIKFQLTGLNTVTGNRLLLPNGGVIPFLYVNMDPANIILSMNNVSVVSSPVTCDHSVYNTYFSAGLESPYLENLIDPPLADGCASCAGVPYSGLVLSVCDACNEPDLACFVPTMSQWGMIVLTAQLLVAGTLLFGSVRDGKWVDG